MQQSKAKHAMQEIYWPPPERAVLSGTTGLLGSLEVLQTAKLPVTRADLKATIEGGVAKLRPLRKCWFRKGPHELVVAEGPQVG